MSTVTVRSTALRGSPTKTHARGVRQLRRRPNKRGTRRRHHPVLGRATQTPALRRRGVGCWPKGCRGRAHRRARARDESATRARDDRSRAALGAGRNSQVSIDSSTSTAPRIASPAGWDASPGGGALRRLRRARLLKPSRSRVDPWSNRRAPRETLARPDFWSVLSRRNPVAAGECGLSSTRGSDPDSSPLLSEWAPDDRPLSSLPR
jgi:hypothetical protein